MNSFISPEQHTLLQFATKSNWVRLETQAGPKQKNDGRRLSRLAVRNLVHIKKDEMGVMIYQITPLGKHMLKQVTSV